ncbi:MAG: PadR family transcriptional regulator [Dehalococcoidia bacterium]|nr:PadR family transcriptional regulator [Dehalococcoidia bacterium]
MLDVLVQGPMHAYEVKRRLAPDAGHSSIYAALSRAEGKGYVTSTWEALDARPPGSGPRRKYYELTALGQEALNDLREDAVAWRISPIRKAPRSVQS